MPTGVYKHPPQCGFQKGHKIQYKHYPQQGFQKEHPFYGNLSSLNYFQKGNHPRTEFKKGRKHTKEWKKKISILMTRKWRNSIFRDKQIKAIMNSQVIKPNKPEIFLTQLLNKILPNEYKYVGDGQFILGGKCPDFFNVNGKKKLIELYGDYWHKNDNPQDRIDYFKKYGFDTLVIWESELQKQDLKSRILEFN